MNEVFFEELGIPRPEFVLDYPPESRHGAQTAVMLRLIEEIFIKERPRGVLVYGDTNSTLAGALAASKLTVPIFHVEAGLRSFNKAMPEEVNRVLTDHLSSLLFAPTTTAVRHLEREGLTEGVHLVGDVMCDVLREQSQHLVAPREGAYVFCTLHRPSNVDDPVRLRAILEALDRCRFPVFFPLHPRTESVMERAGLERSDFPGIEFVNPLSYRECLAYQKFSLVVATDSGGLQKEAYLLGKRCLTLREETEWTETLNGGCNTLVGSRIEELPELLELPHKLEFKDVYGDGHSAERVADIMAQKLRQ